MCLFGVCTACMQSPDDPFKNPDKVVCHIVLVCPPTDEASAFATAKVLSSLPVRCCLQLAWLWPHHHQSTHVGFPKVQVMGTLASTHLPTPDAVAVAVGPSQPSRARAYALHVTGGIGAAASCAALRC